MLTENPQFNPVSSPDGLRRAAKGKRVWGFVASGVGRAAGRAEDVTGTAAPAVTGTGAGVFARGLGGGIRECPTLARPTFTDSS
jgi:hypothetical protein